MVKRIVRMGTDARGKVVKKLKDAVMVIEMELDEQGKLVRETFCHTDGKGLPPNVTKK